MKIKPKPWQCLFEIRLITQIRCKSVLMKILKLSMNLNHYEYSLLSEVTIHFNYVYLKMITLLTKRKRNPRRGAITLIEMLMQIKATSCFSSFPCR